MKRTAETKTESKLGTGLEHKTLKFTDYAIFKFQSIFKVNGKTKDRIKTPFDISKNTKLKGLKLCQYEATNKKYAIQQFWFNGKPDYWTVGEFRLGFEGQPPLFGTKQCEEKVYEIAKEHQDEKGIWIKNPKITLKHRRERIKKGLQKKLKLGNIKSKRDWGHAQDYVNAMWSMLQQDNPGDYVVGTGIEHSVENFAKRAFAHVDLNYKDYVVIDNNLIRPTEVDTLVANYSKAKKILKWEPKISFDNLVIDMVESDLKFITNYV